MGHVLNADQRRHLDTTIQRARTAAEKAAADALHALAVAEPTRPSYLSGGDNVLRLALREKARQLGDDTVRTGAPLTNLVREVAYEQWHRLLFARFLEANGLLRHPEFRDTSLTLEDCADLADDLGEPDGWSVAARFASEILPGVFRLDDPAVQVRIATEHRVQLERILLSLPREVLVTEDALGWVYQFWQTAEKKRVNESGVKIGGADLSPVTQLFTENYMVRFLLENSLGAWWADRHPNSPLVDSWEYLRRLDDGTPAAGTFAEWPKTAAEVTVLDPCCGSGHFLVAMFGMLWRMRAEEEGLSPVEAQDAVLRDNLYGLELDPRCTQLATFNIALEAWKQGGYRDLPAPQITCSGVPVRGTRGEWEAHAGDNDELRRVLVGLHSLFRNADTLGSLIAPKSSDAGDALFGRDLNVGAGWESVRTALGQILRAEQRHETVLGHAADDVVHAAGLLSRTYTLVATNPPFLNDQKMSPILLGHCKAGWPDAAAELATTFIAAFKSRLGPGGAMAFVSPNNWLYLKPYITFRMKALRGHEIPVMAQLGPNSFAELNGEVVKPILSIHVPGRPSDAMYMLDVSEHRPDERGNALRTEPPFITTGATQQNNPNSAITFRSAQAKHYLSDYCTAHLGISTGDNNRFARKFWEFARQEPGWERIVGTVSVSSPYSGRSEYLKWQDGTGELYDFITERLGDGRQGSWIRGRGAWGGQGICASRAGTFPTTIYFGELFLDGAAVLIPKDVGHLPAIWHFMQSPEYARSVRAINQKVIATVSSLPKVPFDLERWENIAIEAGPLPPTASQDLTQWLFKGQVETSDMPLQVAVARLLGFRWPDQEPDHLDDFADSDGIAALQSLAGEPDLASRLRALLAVVYRDEWSSTRERALVTEAGGKNGRLEDWLRDAFFAQHVKVFNNRPFLWHVWDGRKDGFSAIVNYHRLDHPTLEKLTFGVLGAWIERQRHEAEAGRAGADTRLTAAEDLQRRLKLILEGAPIHDVYVRWKNLHEQPIGWHPDLNDGVRLNIRPFVTARVLRSKVNLHWNKDKGTNADGSERMNDLHPTLEERREARRLAGAQL
ncbi:N-6 DNA methylase [Burkholderia sp. RS01]|uniref:Eco57I restriction-modification methylase domain-containing protein n=1 Tax=unclassified Burkholderia TaxID=2613784 RepID=UPI00321862DC